MSIGELLSITEIVPATSPSEINFIFTFNAFKSSIIFLCLSLFSIQAVSLSGVVFFASANIDIFFLTPLSKSNRFFGKLAPTAIFSM